MTHRCNAKIILLFCFFNLSSLVLFAQETQESKFRFGIESNIGISDRYKVGTLPQDHGLPYEFLDLLNVLDGPKLTHEFGIVFDFAIQKKITLASGVKYVVWGFNSKKREPLVNADYHHFKLKERSSFIEIPLKLKYYLNTNKNRFYISCGYSPTVFLNTIEIGILYYTDEKEKLKNKDELRKFRKINMTGELGIGYEKTISNKFVLSINPNFRIQNFTFFDDERATQNRRLFFYGISFSLMTKL